VNARLVEVRRLHRQRPQRPFVVWSLRLMALIVAASWLGGGLLGGDLLSARRREHVGRFLHDLRPWPVRDTAWQWREVAAWADGLWRAQGAEALLATLAVSVLAIVLAGAMAAVWAPLAARTLAAPEPFVQGGRPPRRPTRAAWAAVVGASRLVLVFLRAVPEYVWAFLLLAMYGPTPWPLVAALALHNAGILGRLGAEVVENTDRAAPGALRALGASRRQLGFVALVPLGLPRFLLYFFYRWETAVREATILGMLGLGTLGFCIVDARSRNRYDEMLFYVGLGVVLVLVGDLVSAAVRRAVRRA
jgi:phosphonate transport system permease protein